MANESLRKQNTTIRDCWELIKMTYEKKRLKKIILLLISLLITINLYATTYFISSNGSDGASGSAMFPWKTLAYACQHTVSGDVIFVRAGVYAETQISYVPSGVSIEGEGSSSRLVGSYIILSGPGGNQSISNLRIDGNNIAGGNNILINGRHDIVITKCSFNNFTAGNLFYATEAMEYAIDVWFSYNIEIHNNTIEAGIRSIGNNRNLNIHHNTIGKVSLGANPEVGVYLCDVDDVHIWNNKFKNLATAIVIVAYGTTIVRDVYIYCNLMINAGVSPPEIWGYGSGIQFCGLTSGIVRNINILNNTIVGNPGNRQTMIGVWLPTVGDGKLIVVRNNIIQGFQYASIFAAGPEQRMDSVFIENNILFENAILGDGFAPDNQPYFTNVPQPPYKVQQNNIMSNPLFIGSGDYHLQSNSPGVGGGYYMPFITMYHDGDYYTSPPNIGAYNGYMTIVVDPSTIKDEMLIYPIPADDNISIMIKNPNFRPVKLQILNYSGRIMVDEKMDTDEILHLPIDLAPGLYVVRAINKKQEMIVQKIIVK
jgi:hypothetical protein